MAEYLVLIYEDEAGYATGDQTRDRRRDGRPTTSSASQRCGVAARRQRAAADRDRDLDPARRRRVRSPSPTAPFAETKEALGGYYLIEAADLDEAIAIAKQIPAPFGGVEVRPIMVFD